jgi:hypothetical protein
MAEWVLDREGGRYNIQAAENGNGVSPHDISPKIRRRPERPVLPA